MQLLVFFMTDNWLFLSHKNEGFCNEAKLQTVLFAIEARRAEIANNSLIDEGEARAINVKVCQFAELQN